MLLDRIDELRKERGLSRRQIALACGMDASTISKWRDNPPKIDNLKRVADYLNVSIDYLTGVSDVRKIEQRTYYTDSETEEKAAESYKKHRILYDVSRDLAPSQLDLLINMANQMKGTNRDG